MAHELYRLISTLDTQLTRGSLLGGVTACDSDLLSYPGFDSDRSPGFNSSRVRVFAWLSADFELWGVGGVRVTGSAVTPVYHKSDPVDMMVR